MAFRHILYHANSVELKKYHMHARKNLLSIRQILKSKKCSDF